MKREKKGEARMKKEKVVVKVSCQELITFAHNRGMVTSQFSRLSSV